jgi:glucokinase
MLLGIEIGGTKLQFAIGSGRGGRLRGLKRLEVDRAQGAEGIRRQIVEVGRRLAERYGATAVGIGFGGPVEATAARVIRSFQVEGWNGFPLGEWCRQELGLPTAVGNDSDMAGLAEARFGAGRGHRVVLYSNVGSGIGGSLVIAGKLYSGGSGVVCEIGHLRPGLDALSPEQTVESLASGFGMAAVARARIGGRQADDEAAADLRRRCRGPIEELTARIVVEAAAEGNALAGEILRGGVRAYGWALAQAVTLFGPNAVIVGGGVPQIGDALFLSPLRGEVDRYVYPPLRGRFQVLPAALGEEVVVHGALALAATVAPKRRRRPSSAASG